MIERLVRISIRRRWAAVVVSLLVAAFGIKSYLDTSIEAFPDVTNVQVTVIAQLPGYAPEEVERQLTVPLERVLNGTPGMISLRSESLYGLSLVSLTFEDGQDTFVARTIVTQRAETADLPDGVIPSLAPEATPLGEIYQFRLVSDRHDLYDLRSELDWTVGRILRQVPGVADVVSFGGFLREVAVELDPQRLEAAGLTLADVTEALEESNLNVGGGFIQQGDQELTVRGLGALESIEDVRDVVLEQHDGTPITLSDVSARIVRSSTPRRGEVGYGADPEAVEGFVLLRRGENPSDVLALVHEKVAELNDGGVLPEGMKIVPFYDRSTLVAHTLDTVHENLLHGFLLIVGIVWLFVRSIAGSIAVAVVIPLALLTAFIGLSLLGLPANLISLGAIDFGILVDGAVVLVENVLHRQAENPPRNRFELLRIVLRGALDVARPTFYAMAIIIAALLPVFTLERVEGRIFRPLALTYSLALVGALVFSLTVVPAVCALLLRVKATAKAHADPLFVRLLRAGYRKLLSGLMRARWIAALVIGGLVTTTAMVGASLGTEFLPELDEGDFVVFVEMPPSISRERAQEVLVDVRKSLMESPEVKEVLSEHGRPEDGTDNEGVNMSETFVHLRDKSEWREGLTKDGLIEEMRTRLTAIPGVSFNFSQPIKDNIEEAISGVRGKVVLKIFGSDLDVLRATLLEAKETLSKVEGITDLDLYRDAAIPQLTIQLNRQSLARHGVSVGVAQATIETALAGRVVTTMREGERTVPVRVRFPGDAREDVDSVKALAIPTPLGARIPLSDLAAVAIHEGRAVIPREANSRFAALKFNIEGRDMGSVVADAQRVVADGVKLPPSTYWQWGGEFENQARAMGRLQIVIPIALIVVIFLLYSALGSGRGAFMIVLLLPGAIAGGVVALALANVALSVSAAIGFIALMGQVSLVGLLVVSAIEAQRTEGVGFMEAIIGGATERLRAVVMASLLAILGLLPMVISSGVGSETQRPFALVIVGGMVSTIIAGLFVLPVLYSVLAKKVVAGGEVSEEDTL